MRVFYKAHQTALFGIGQIIGAHVGAGGGALGPLSFLLAAVL